MVSTIYELKTDGSGKGVTEKAVYTITAKQALINFIQQYILHNWNTWQYPAEYKGIYESPSKPGVFYYEDENNQRILMAKEDK